MWLCCSTRTVEASNLKDLWNQFWNYSSFQKAGRQINSAILWLCVTSRTHSEGQQQALHPSLPNWIIIMVWFFKITLLRLLSLDICFSKSFKLHWQIKQMPSDNLLWDNKNCKSTLNSTDWSLNYITLLIRLSRFES